VKSDILVKAGLKKQEVNFTLHTISWHYFLF